jgi:hypothetical protein
MYRHQQIWIGIPSILAFGQLPVAFNIWFREHEGSDARPKEFVAVVLALDEQTEPDPNQASFIVA